MGNSRKGANCIIIIADNVAVVSMRFFHYRLISWLWQSLINVDPEYNVSEGS
jgi:hypothetical protein